MMVPPLDPYPPRRHCRRNAPQTSHSLSHKDNPPGLEAHWTHNDVAVDTTAVCQLTILPYTHLQPYQAQWDGN